MADRKIRGCLFSHSIANHFDLYQVRFILSRLSSLHIGRFEVRMINMVGLAVVQPPKQLKTLDTNNVLF